MPLLTDAHGHLQADRFNDDYQQHYNHHSSAYCAGCTDVSERYIG